MSDAILRGAILDGAQLTHANMASADLSDARLVRAGLAAASLYGTRLQSANLSRADLQSSEIIEANFTDANLSKASLSGSTILGGLFRNADLRGAVLYQARLSAVDLDGAKLDHCTLESTIFIDVDLSPFCRASGIRFASPCTVDYRSIILSMREPSLKDFLRATGMPDLFIEYTVDCAKSLAPDVVFSLLQSTFISYGAPDQLFARKLGDALNREGVRTYVFSRDAIPGEPLHETMRRGVNEHDRVILTCSKNAMDRKGLLNELEETLRREARDASSYLIPVTLDSYLFDSWNPSNAGIKQAVLDRSVADFRGWSDDETVFRNGVSKLVQALKRPTSQRR